MENPFRAEGLTTAGRFAVLTLQPGVRTEIAVRFRYLPRFEYTPDLTEDGYRLAALLYGPFVMVTEDASEDFLTFDAERLPIPAPGRFSLWFCSRRFIPMYEAHGIPYHTYFKLK